MKRISKDKYCLEIAKAVSKRSTCLKRRYGCVIVKNDEIIATGYNGSPRGELNCCDIYESCPRKSVEHNSGNYGDCKSVHAEQNAMLSASRKDMIGATLYLAGEEYVEGFDYPDINIHYSSGWKEILECIPCPICERMIRNAGITRVVNDKGVLFKWD